MRWKERFERLRVAYSETGLIGVTRRSLRVGVTRLSRRLEKLATKLYYQEAAARLTPQMVHEAGRSHRFLVDKLQDSTVFILGTGPSLGKLNLEETRNFRTIGVNSYFRHPSAAESNPDLYCFLDGHYFKDTPEVAEFFVEVQDVIRASHFVVTSEGMDNLQRREWLPRDRTYLIPIDGNLGDAPSDRLKLGSVLPSAPNAVMFAALLAVLAGARTIVLLGVDHNWLSIPNQVLQLTDSHFYSHTERVVPPATTQAEWNERRNYLAMMEWCQMIWRCYYRLDAVAKERGAMILNATPNSFLDVFPYVDYCWAVSNLPKSGPWRA